MWKWLAGARCVSVEGACWCWVSVGVGGGNL